MKDTWTVLQELEKITQKPGERLRVLASRIEVARRYEETLANTSPADLNKLILVDSSMRLPMKRLRIICFGTFLSRH